MNDRRPLVVRHEDPASPLSWTVGDVTVTRVVETVIELPPAFLLPDLSADLIGSCLPWAAPFFTDDLTEMLLSVHSFVVQRGDLTVVVDTCVAAHVERPLPGDAGFGDRLAAVIPGGADAVDVVVCTHLHFDHVGWNTRLVDGAFVPTFPNARYLVSVDELASVRADDAMQVMAPSIAPLLDAGLLDAVDGSHRIDECISLMPSPGHSPGHVCVLIDSRGQRALITGDATHSPVQFAHPDVSATHADSDSARASETRRALLAQFTDTDTLVLGTHFAPPTAGRLRSGPDRAWFDTGPLH